MSYIHNIVNGGTVFGGGTALTKFQKLATPFALALALGACANMITPQQLAADEAIVINDVKQICSVIPNAIDVGALLLNNPGIADLGALAQQICNLIPTPPAPSSSHRRVIRGQWVPDPIVINGNIVHFVPTLGDTTIYK